MAHRIGTRRFFRPPLALLLLVALPCLFAISAMAAGDPKPGTILVRELNMRSGPGRHNPPIATLKKGDRVYVLSYEGEWVRILYKDQTGFIMNRERYLRIEEPRAVAAEEDKTSAVSSEADASVSRELAASRQKVASFAKEEKAVIDALDDTERALNRARKKVARLSKELETIDTRIRELEKEYRKVEKHAESNESYVAVRLAALYKLSWLGKFHVLASADSMFDFFADKRSLEQILAHDEKVLAALARDKEQMQVLLQKLVVKKNDKQATAADLSARIETMNGEQARREALLKEIRSKKSLQMAAIESLKTSASALDRTVASFSNAAIEASEPPVVVPEKPFASLKGLLMMPVKGKIISFFGRYKDRRFNVTRFQSGVYIQADRGEPIRAVYSGKTLFSSWFKGFGNMIIMDHGDHYYTVYAHLEEQFKSKGDPVEAGEVIATVGDTGSFTGAGLHFEVRHHGKPMNPMKWIKKG